MSVIINFHVIITTTVIIMVASFGEKNVQITSCLIISLFQIDIKECELNARSTNE